MPPTVYEFFASLTYPPTLTLWLSLFGIVAMASRWRKSGLGLVGLALAWSLLWSIPQCSDWLRESLERRHPVVAERLLPNADAIVVLGGGSRYTWLDRKHVNPEQIRSSRLAAGARAWMAGRAPIIVLSGGGGIGRSEAGTMARAIARLGVPASALILEESSRSTRDNAVFTAELAKHRGIRRVLLVTSAVHMPRANLLFRQAGIDVVPVPVPERALRRDWKDRWLPTRSALWRSGRALKEYAALFAVCTETQIKERSGLASRGRNEWK